MSVYVDNFYVAANVKNGAHTVRGKWCHMVADTREELDAMADTIGMRRSWIQHPGTRKEHYDVTMSKRKLAVAAGAIEVSATALARWMREGRPSEGPKGAADGKAWEDGAWM